MSFLAGRTTLAKSVVSSIPIYPMMVTKLPNSIISEIERQQRAFIWGHEYEERKMHPVGWNVVNMARDCGGLDVKNLSIMNEACLSKIV